MGPLTIVSIVRDPKYGSLLPKLSQFMLLWRRVVTRILIILRTIDCPKFGVVLMLN